MRRNLLLTLRYNGTRYHGFQVQAGEPTVTQAFQDAVERVFGVREDITGCSRTDAGVHANMYCLNLRTELNIPCSRVVTALNTGLPDDIAVTSCREVPQDFHARYAAVGKEYLYKIHNSPLKDPFLENLALRWRWPLDEALLHRAAQQFVGTHDFTAVCAGNEPRNGNIRTIFRFDVARQGEMVYLRVAGDGFLYKMVRILVGTLLKVAQGGLAPEELGALLERRDRAAAGDTARACGLYLNRVFYELDGFRMNEVKG